MTIIKLSYRIYGVKATTATYCFKAKINEILKFTHLFVALNSKDAYSDLFFRIKTLRPLVQFQPPLCGVAQLSRARGHLLRILSKSK